MTPAKAKERPPGRPGPGPMPADVLRALDLTVKRRVESVVPGDHRTSVLGPGTELAQVRPYQPGDDVRMIDWNVTARTGEPHVRVQVAERALTTWLVLDASPSMTFGTAERRKADVAEGVSLAVGHMATRHGNRLGLVTFGVRQPRTVRPLQGRRGLLGLLTTLRAEPEPDGAGATSLGEALERTGALAVQRGLVVIVSDFRGPIDWAKPLMRLRSRHAMIAVEIRDPREQELPAVGDLWLVDPETGRQLRVDTNSRKLRQRFAARAAREREALAAALHSAGADHVVLSTAGDWLRELVSFMRRGRRR